ncbi:MFS transporter [Yersinia pekkanenii]|uniref:Transporter protein n=1 Tax=Yersinia pekkanenii TaxID=1288385 RepID=A0A0T9R464_9GAMM|nr:MFS transporter [Yersinia pekkanenii]CNI43156.1 putative transporter protein [Yersinia pekkanenii]CRY68374.1 putative transporter protein [Yersinia pekkanenii]
MATDLNVSPLTIGLVVTPTPSGYALGLIFIVLLGNRWDRRKLIIGQLLLSAEALILVSLVPTFSLLLMGDADYRPDGCRCAGYMLFHSIGSAISTTTVDANAGWSGVCVLGAMISAVAMLFLHLTYRKYSTV